MLYVLCYMRLNAQELRTVDEGEVQTRIASLSRHPIFFIVENVYDTYNVGGLFRLADAIGASKIYLCGQTEIPPNSKIKKASVGTYKVMPWEYKRSSAEAIHELRNLKLQNTNSKQSPNPKIQIIAVEQNNKSVPYTKISYSFPVALIFGNETSGVTKQTLALADHIAEIPMWGINRSLNVIVSATIVAYHVMGKMEP